MVVAKLKYVNQKSIILSHVPNLKGKTNIKKKLFFVREEVSSSQNEVRNYYKDLVKENRMNTEESERKQLRMQRGLIFCNNLQVRKKISKPSIAKTLKLTNHQIEEAMAIKLVEGGDYVESGSEFLSFVHKARTVDEVNKGYQKMKIKYADATHISCVYRLANPSLAQD